MTGLTWKGVWAFRRGLFRLYTCCWWCVLFFVAKKEPSQAIKSEGTSTPVKRENSAEYQTIDKNCDIFSGEISSVENAPKAESTSSGELKIKIKIDAPLKGFICKPKNTPKKEKRQTPKKNIHQYVCKTCGDKFTTLGTLQKHVLNHTKEVKAQYKVEKPCCVAVCDNQFVKNQCEPRHEKVVAKLRKAKEDEKTVAEEHAAAEATTEEEPMIEGDDDMELPGNTLAGYYLLIFVHHSQHSRLQF